MLLADALAIIPIAANLPFLGAHALCRIHRLALRWIQLDLVSISHAFGFKSTISHFVGRIHILTRSDRSMDFEVTSLTTRLAVQHEGAAGLQSEAHGSEDHSRLVLAFTAAFWNIDCASLLLLMLVGIRAVGVPLIPR